MIAQTIQKSGGAPSFRVGDERLIKLTENAGKKVGALLSKQGRPNGVLRVAVVGGGCSGLQYKMDLQDHPANRDFLVESAGTRVVVDPKSALYVTGSELDYSDALSEGGFQGEQVRRGRASATLRAGPDAPPARRSHRGPARPRRACPLSEHAGTRGTPGSPR